MTRVKATRKLLWKVSKYALHYIFISYINAIEGQGIGIRYQNNELRSFARRTIHHKPVRASGSLAIINPVY